MAIKIWRGDEQARAQITVVTVDNPEPDDSFTLTINRKDLEFVCDEDDALQDSGLTAEKYMVDNVLRGLAALIGSYENTIPEWAECRAVPYVPSTATDGLATELWIYGPIDGKPVTITGSSSDAGAQTVTVETITAGDAGTNEIQVVTIPGTPTGGTFTITFEGQTTGTIAYNASAATVETALEALSNIGSGDVSVSGDAGGPYTVEFTGALAATNVAKMTANGASLTGGNTVSVVTTTEGGSGANEIWSFSWDNTGSDLTDSDYVNFIGFKIYDQLASGSQTGRINITVADSAATIRSRINDALALGGGNSVTVTKTIDDPANDPTGVNAATVTVEWSDGVMSGINLGDTSPVPIEIVYVANNSSEAHADQSEVPVAKVQDGGSPSDEIQVVSLPNGPTGGTFTLTFEGQTTGNISYAATAASVETALEALSNVTGVTVSGDAGGPWTVTFDTSPQAGNDVALMTGSGASLTGMTPVVSVTQQSVAAVNEVQRVTVGNSTGGTFTLTWDPGGGDETTGNIAYDASAATVEAALVALTTPSAGDFAVTGDDGGPWDVEFTGTYAASNVDEMTGNGANLTGFGTQTITVTDDGSGNSVTPLGPNWVSHADNWQDTSTSTASAPANGDVLVFENNAVDCLYGLDELSAVTLLELHVRASYTGRLGLATHTGEYFEYRPTALEVGATSVWIGEGDGAGSPLIRLDLGSVQSAIEVWQTGTPEDEQPAFQFQGTHTSNILRVYRGSVGVGTEQWEDAAALASMVVAYVDSEESDAQVYIGPNVTTLGTVDQTGGTVVIDGDSTLTVTTWQLEAGSVVFGGEAAVTTFRARNGEVVYNSSGTCTTMDIGPGGVVQLNQDQRSRTFTNTTMAAGATLLDPGSTVTFANGIDLDNCGLPEVTLDVGRAVTITPS